MTRAMDRSVPSWLPVLAAVATVAVIVVACSSAVPGGTPAWTCPSQPPSASYVTGAWPDSVAIADLDRDGKKDLVVANWDSGTVSVLLGKGDGTFGQATSYATPPVPSGASLCPQGVGPVCTALFVAVGDFNGDGVPDLVVANTTARRISIFLGNGDGTFRPRVDQLTSAQPTSLAVADFDGDGASDVAVTNVSTSGGQVTPAPIDVFFGDRGGTLRTEIDHLGAALAAEFAVAADFDHDGKADLAVVSPSTNTVSVFLGNGNGTFRPNVDYAVSGSPNYLATGDFDGDGYVDLAAVSPATSTVTILLADRDGTFRPKIDYVMNAPGAISVATGDFNGDRKLDLMVGVASTRTVVVLLGRGDGTFERPVEYGSGVNPLSLAAADFNGDGRDDLAVAGGCATSRCDTIENDNVSTFLSCAQ